MPAGSGEVAAAALPPNPAQRPLAANRCHQFEETADILRSAVTNLRALGDGIA